MYKILIADDEIKIRETLRDYLSAKGFDVTLAKDGETAVYSAEGESFDLIILDVLMPKKDGLEACKEIREFTDIPILFLSALGQEEDLLKGYKFGADDYIRLSYCYSDEELKTGMDRLEAFIATL